jgi:3-deoxy-manno-octulosonate cytidylyltransferase (CMP-KDO synthetase)
MNIGIIPARLNSTRLSNKILKDINSLPMIVRVAKQVEQSTMLDEVIVAVDDAEVYNIVNSYGINTIMTSTNHKTGTDRIAEIAEKFNSNDIIINIQGDEPLISSQLIDDFILLFDDRNIKMATIASTHLSVNELNDKNVVKVCIDKNMYAETFSRDVLSDEMISKLGGLYKHLGIYGFEQSTLLKYTSLPQSDTERLLSLEQVRALENNIKIKVLITDYSAVSVDTKNDLKRVRQIIKKKEKQSEYDRHIGYYKQLYKGHYNSDLTENATLMIAKILDSVFSKEDAKTLLDYGSGRGIQYTDKKIHEKWGIQNVRCYDPAIEKYAIKPDKTENFDAIVCIDVMEHIPERSVDDILQDIFEYKSNLVFFSISTIPAHAKLPDGSNAHCTTKPAEWWLKKLKAFKREQPQIKILLKVETDLFVIENK